MEFPKDMTLRDWYAGQALIGLLGNMHSHNTHKQMVQSALDIADDMLHVREMSPNDRRTHGRD